MNYLEAWNRFGRLTYDDLPEDVARVAHHCVLDWTGCASAGSREPLAELLRAEYAHRAGDCRVIGHDKQADAETAALLNGASGHALDYDDTNPAVGCHATAPVLPAVLAAADMLGASGADLITAFVVGVEIEARVGRAIGTEHYNRGWHTTATFGAFGATAAVAHLLQLDGAQYAVAMGLAASRASGVKANFGTMTKPYHAGLAAASGVAAAQLAARGFTANPDAVFGNQGYLQAAATGRAYDERVNAVADRWLIAETLFKHHAACHLTHAAIEGVRSLRHTAPPAEVQEVILTVHPSILDVCGIPEPDTGLEGKFSLRCTAAMALLGIDTANPQVFVDALIRRDDVQHTLRRVTVETDPSLTTMQTRVNLLWGDGERREAWHDTNLPERDLDRQQQQLLAKFESLTGDARRGEAILGLGSQAHITL